MDGDGIADYYVRGPDRACVGIPDVVRESESSSSTHELQRRMTARGAHRLIDSADKAHQQDDSTDGNGDTDGTGSGDGNSSRGSAGSREANGSTDEWQQAGSTDGGQGSVGSRDGHNNNTGSGVAEHPTEMIDLTPALSPLKLPSSSESNNHQDDSADRAHPDRRHTEGHLDRRHTEGHADRDSNGSRADTDHNETADGIHRSEGDNRAIATTLAIATTGAIAGDSSMDGGDRGNSTSADAALLTAAAAFLKLPGSSSAAGGNGLVGDGLYGLDDDGESGEPISPIHTKPLVSADSDSDEIEKWAEL